MVVTLVLQMFPPDAGGKLVGQDEDYDHVRGFVEEQNSDQQGRPSTVVHSLVSWLLPQHVYHISCI